MRVSVAVAFVLSIALALPLVPSVSRAAANPPAPLGGFVDSIRFIQQPNQAQALLDLKSGAMDIYTFPLRTAADIHAAHTDPDLNTVDANGGEDNLFVNPVPVNQTLAPGVFNLFGIREIREALNYLVDRNHVNQLIFEGYGTPHATLWNNASPEAARDPFFFADVNRAYGYDFDRARTIIFNALNASGATYNGTWSWQGQPIVVQMIIRIEDTRRDIGNYIADQIERLGLSVNRQVVSAGVAFSIVYNGPPDTGAWMLYTEGWADVFEKRWPDAALNFYDCGGEGSNVWSYYSPPPALKDVCTRLANGQYSSEAERQQLIETGVTLALNSSVRVWLVAGGQTQVYSKRVGALAVDGAGGVWSPFTLRTARFATPGGTLTVGNRLQFLSPFQPWQGLGWLYDSLIGNIIMDPGVITHPKTGAYIPVRSDFQTVTAGPNGTLNVPADALTWDPTTMGFTNVGSGITSKSKVTFHYTFGSWHDGPAMSMDDVLYNIALMMRRARGDVSLHDSDAVNLHDRAFTDSFRGLQVVDPTTLDIYIDYWHLDPSFIAAAADVWPATPWEVGELAMATTLHDHSRVSEISAANDNLNPIDLAIGPVLGYMDGEISDGNITTSGAAVTRPPGLQSYIDQSEAEARWYALLAWRANHGGYFIGNGPFSLDAVDPNSLVATTTSFGPYPFPADRWDGLVTPPTPDLSIDPIANVVQGQSGEVNLTTTVSGVPYDNATVLFRIRPLHNETTLLTGIAVLAGPGAWRVRLDPGFTSNLSIGTYLFQAAANGNETSTVAFAERTFQVTLGQGDTAAPTSSIDTLAAWYTAGLIHLNGTATDDRSGIASVDLYVAFSRDGGMWPSPAWVATSTSAPFSFDVAPSGGDGHYRFWSVAMDGAGNVESLSGKSATGDAEAGFDSVPPGVYVLPGISYWQTAPITLTTDFVETTSGIASVDLYASYSPDTSTWTGPALVATDTSSPFTFTYAPTQDGNFRVWALGTDRAGNRESLGSQAPTGEVTFGIDRLAPSASIVPFATYWQRSGPFSIYVTATDDRSGVLAVSLIVSYSADGVTWSIPALAGTDSIPPFEFSYAPNHGDGRYRFWAWPVDQAGNTAAIGTPPNDPQAEVGLDSVGPSILSSGPSDGASGVATTTPIRIAFSEAVDHAAAEAAFSIAPAVPGTFSWEGSTLVFTPSSSLAAETVYHVTVRAGVPDAAGNGLPSEYGISFTTGGVASPLGMSGTVVVGAIVIAAVIVAAALIWWRRARRKT